VGTFLTSRTWLRQIKAHAVPGVIKNVSLIVVGSESGHWGERSNADYSTGKAAVQLWADAELEGRCTSHLQGWARQCNYARPSGHAAIQDRMRGGSVAIVQKLTGHVCQRQAYPEEGCSQGNFVSGERVVKWKYHGAYSGCVWRKDWEGDVVAGRVEMDRMKYKLF
jgi:hypothetical protein